MRTSMAFPIRFWASLLAILLMYQFSTDASADWCKYEKEIDLTLDLSDSDVLLITAAAGESRHPRQSLCIKASLAG